MSQPPRARWDSGEAIRREIDRHLSSPLVDVEWATLVREDYIAEVQDEHLSIEEVAATVRERRATWGGSRYAVSGGRGSEPQLLPPPPDDQPASEQPALDRQVVLSHTLWALAGKDPEVRAFRHEVLGDSLLTYLPFRLLALQDLDIGRRFFGDAAEDVFTRLRGLSARLARRYHWMQEAAVAFVLGGMVPLAEMLSAQFEPHPDVPALARIIIEADPNLSPNEVASLFREMRRQVAGRRPREMNQRHLWLAVFVARRPEGELLKDQMAAWNDRYPEWAYTQVTNFGRDRAAVREWVLGRQDHVGRGSK